MGVIVKPKNLNDRQVKRVDRIEESNPLRARTVASRISARRDARGAENPQMAKMPGAKKAMAQPMKKGGKIIKKAQNGKVLKAPTAQKGDTSRKMGLNFDKKSFDSLPKLKTKAKNGTSFGMLSVKAGVDNNPSATFADKIAGAKKKAKFGKKMQYGGEAASMVPTMKKGGKATYGKSMMTKGGKMKMGGKCKNGC